MEERVDNNQVNLILHREQLGVHDNSISQLEDQVNVLGNTDVTIQERLDALETVNTNTEQRLDELETAVNEISVPDELVEQLSYLENITETQQIDISKLYSIASALDDEINTLQIADGGFEQRISELEDGYRLNNVSIGFHAIYPSNSNPAGTPLLYDKVRINIGDRYSRETGIFTANIAGLYYFEQYWVAIWGSEGYLSIQKNQIKQCWSFGTEGSMNEFHSASCSAVMELVPGDQVYVTSSEGNMIGFIGSTGFTGFLIKAYN